MPRSHSRATTSDVNSVPIKVSTIATAPGSRAYWLFSSGLNQMRGSVDDRRGGLGPVHQRVSGGGFLLEPVRPQALDVVLHQPGGVGVAAVHEHLDRRGLAAAEPVAEVGRQHDDPFEPSGHQVVLDGLAVPGEADLEITRVAERGQEAVGLGRRPLDHHRDRDPPQVERDAKAEDEQQQKRQDSGDHEAARVAHHLQRFLADQPGQTPQPAAAAWLGHGGNMAGMRRPGHGAGCDVMAGPRGRILRPAR